MGRGGGGRGEEVEEEEGGRKKKEGICKIRTNSKLYEELYLRLRNFSKDYAYFDTKRVLKKFLT